MGETRPFIGLLAQPEGVVVTTQNSGHLAALEYWDAAILTQFASEIMGRPGAQYAGEVPEGWTCAGNTVNRHRQDPGPEIRIILPFGAQFSPRDAPGITPWSLMVNDRVISPACTQPPLAADFSFVY